MAMSDGGNAQAKCYPLVLDQVRTLIHIEFISHLVGKYIDIRSAGLLGDIPPFQRFQRIIQLMRDDLKLYRLTSMI
jgi:hypothetical protein